MPPALTRRRSAPNFLLIGGSAFASGRMESLLGAAGLPFVRVTSAAEARAAMDILFFSIVVIDRVLPDADGIELCHEVRRNDRNGRAYIFVLSALDSVDDVAKGLAAGADDCLSECSSDGELLEQLRRASLHVSSLSPEVNFRGGE